MGALSHAYGDGSAGRVGLPLTELFASCRFGEAEHRPRFAEWILFPEKDGKEYAVRARLGQCRECGEPVYLSEDTERFIRDYLWAGHVFQLERSAVGFTVRSGEWPTFFVKADDFKQLEDGIYRELLRCLTEADGEEKIG